MRTISVYIKRLLCPFRKWLGRFVIVENINLTSQSKDKLFYKVGCFIASDMIEGDYLEFGVFRGYTFSQAFHLIKQAYEQSFTVSVWNTDQDCENRRNIWNEMRFIAFDSFEGLPKPLGVDVLSNEFVEGKFSNSEANFIDYATSNGVSRNRLVTVPGWFNETLNETTRQRYKIVRASIIHIDSDLYESAKLVLDFIEPLLCDGTIIVFDDWFNFKGHPNLGEQKAFSEWLSENPSWNANQYHKEGVFTNSFILNKML